LGGRNFYDHVHDEFREGEAASPTFFDLALRSQSSIRAYSGRQLPPYVPRRQGKDRVDYPEPELQRMLSRTLGMPPFRREEVPIVG
jgi:error-prone DNA polymerase